MATPSEAFISGVIWQTLRQVEVFEVIDVDASGPKCWIRLRGRKTGNEIIVTVEEQRGMAG